VTVIAALVHDGIAFMGADSAAITEGTYDLMIRATPKVFRLGEGADAVLVGVSGSSRWGTVLREYGGNYAPVKDMVRFAGMLQGMADEHGCLAGRAPLCVDAFTLIVWRARIYLLTGSFAVLESHHPYMAIGCGDNIALGALYAGQGACPRIRLQRALEAAEQFSAGVRRPFIIETLASQGAGPEEPQGGLDHA
jgi:ATP-dependent protease HslVU (ClpYQ) peptidase subunit